MLALNIYPCLRPLVLLLDPELVYEKAIRLLSARAMPRLGKNDDAILQTNFFGTTLSNPIGLAAGFDKHGQAINGILNLGFSTIEIGTVTPLAEKAQVRGPRLRFINEAKAVFHRVDVDSIGADAVLENLKAWHNDVNRALKPVGINIGKNSASQKDLNDIAEVMAKVAYYASYMTIHAPSPEAAGETPYKTYLVKYFKQILKLRRQHAPNIPILIKVSPDINVDEQEAIATAAMECDLQGMIIGGTTQSRPSNLPRDITEIKGGVSGGPTFSVSNRVLANIYKTTKGKIPLIGCGGVYNGETAYAKIRAGASYVQLHSALIFEGPLVVERIKRELTELLVKDGFNSVTEAVGKQHSTKQEEA